MLDKEIKLKMLNKFLDLAFESHKWIKNISKNDIEIKLSNEDCINGKAYKKWWKYIIEITELSFDALFRFYDILLQKENNTLNWWLFNVINNIGSWKYQDISFDENKSIMFRDILSIMSIQFLFFHELWHILHWHIDYKISENNNFNSFSEYYETFSNIITTDNSNIENQMLEIDADSFSANLATIFIFNDNNLKNYWIDKNQAIIILIYSIQSIFVFLWLGQVRNNSDLEKLRYIPPRLRLDDIIDVLYSVLNKYYLYNWILTKEKTNNFLSWLEEYYYVYMKSHNYYSMWSSNNNLFELSEDYKNHRVDLEIYWENILRKKLEKFSYIQLFSIFKDFTN